MQAKKCDLPIYARKQPQILDKMNIINHFTAGHIGINSKLSGIMDEGILLIITPLLPQHCLTGLILKHDRAQNTQEVAPDHKAHLTNRIGLIEILKKD